MSRPRRASVTPTPDGFRLGRRFHFALRAWFRRVRRPLPWRQSPDPYRIWVSEVMLQQTQVATVIPYFQRFLQTFPTLPDLAAAPEEQVLRVWEGLGYYRRARSLHRAAKIIAAEYGGEVPRDAATLACLPGIGRYTLGAILSQAFDQRYPAVDANAARVLCRLAAWDQPLETSATQRWLQASAEAILPEQGVGEFNQALMELGSLVCKPRNPDCLLCPVQKWCQAARRGIQEQLPIKAREKQPCAIVEAGVVIRHRHCLLLLKRRADAARWPSLWEFPHLPLQDHEDLSTAVHHLAENELGLRIEPGRLLGVITYGVTRFRYQMHVVEARRIAGRLRLRNHEEARWARPEELHDLPMPSPQRRVVRLIGAQPLECRS